MRECLKVKWCREAKDATQGSEVVPIEEVGGREEMIATQVRSTEVYRQIISHCQG